MDDEPLTITELNAIIKLTLKEALPNQIKITGELFNYKKSGLNIYASIRDSESTLNLIQWKAPQTYANGDAITVSGHIDYFTNKSTINFIAKQIDVEGDGVLYKIYNEIKLKYENKGYFDKIRKKSFPEKLNKIVLITSTNGAALQDILYVLSKGKYPGKIIIKNCLVQGSECPLSISSAIDSINLLYSDIDLIMITRGGGSIEDLMGFSNPVVLESIYQSNIFVMSAVGHQIDSMLSDYVADISAPTPSIGAELLVKSHTNIFTKLELLQAKSSMLRDIILNKLKYLKTNHNNTIYSYQRNKIISLKEKMINTIRSKLLFLKTESERLKLKLESYKKSKYNCSLLKDSILISSIKDIKNGIYTICINDEKINIEIKLI
jgi:exodeoxyribonuclease VII large subunit